MEKLKLQVNETSVNITEQKNIVSGTVGDTAQVVFSDFWDKYLVRAVWQFERTEPIETVESSNGVYLIPAEIVAKRGYFRIGFYGTNGNDVTPTVWSEKISVLQGVPTGLELKEPYPTMYDKLAREKQDKLTYEEYDPANYQGQLIVPYEQSNVGVTIKRWGSIVFIQGCLMATGNVSGWSVGERDIFVNLPFAPTNAFYAHCLSPATEYTSSAVYNKVPFNEMVVKVETDGAIWLCEGTKIAIPPEAVFSINLVYLI